ncbi:MAG: M48 family metallopeptidase [Candidatus Micrarchaeia archaeon]
MEPQVNEYCGVEYKTYYRQIRYPRLEFKTGSLCLILPVAYKDEAVILEKHDKWIRKKIREINDVLASAEKIELETNRTEKEFKQLILGIVNSEKTQLKINVKKVFFRKMKTKWASCSSKRNLTFNTLMRFLPKELIEYITFHEMLHLIEKKHNERFWKILSKKFKDYQEKEKQLFTYWFLIQKLRNDCMTDIIESSLKLKYEKKSKIRNIRSRNR